MTIHWWPLVAAGIFCGLAGSVHAQTSQGRSGSLRVIVDDATDLPIGAADVTVNGANGESRHARTNERGVADVEALPAGRYDVRIESPGFQHAVITALTIRSGARTTQTSPCRLQGWSNKWTCSRLTPIASWRTPSRPT